MKSNMLVGLLAVCVSGSLMGMEEGEKGRLNFQLDNELCITGYSKENMKFAVKPADFLGKNILDVVPLDTKDRDAIVLGLSNAVKQQETIKVPYTLDKMNFAAKITALRTTLKTQQPTNYNYFVKITEIDNNNQ